VLNFSDMAGYADEQGLDHSAARPAVRPVCPSRDAKGTTEISCNCGHSGCSLDEGGGASRTDA